MRMEWIKDKDKNRWEVKIRPARRALIPLIPEAGLAGGGSGHKPAQTMGLWGHAKGNVQYLLYLPFNLPENSGVTLFFTKEWENNS